MDVRAARRLLLCLLLSSLSIWTGCDTTEEPEVIIEDLIVGTGTAAEMGDSLTVHYVGWLEDSTVFISTLDRSKPWSFLLGGGGVIEGWERGLPGMRVGGKRRLTIPPELGYGPKGRDCTGADTTCVPIPPDAVLIFEVDLLRVKKPS